MPKYAQFKDSDCLNWAVTWVPNGKRLAADLVSDHHVFTADQIAAAVAASRVSELECVLH